MICDPSMPLLGDVKWFVGKCPNLSFLGMGFISFDEVYQPIDIRIVQKGRSRDLDYYAADSDVENLQ